MISSSSTRNMPSLANEWCRYYTVKSASNHCQIRFRSFLVRTNSGEICEIQADILPGLQAIYEKELERRCWWIAHLGRTADSAPCGSCQDHCPYFNAPLDHMAECRRWMEKIAKHLYHLTSFRACLVRMEERGLPITSEWTFNLNHHLPTSSKSSCVDSQYSEVPTGGFSACLLVYPEYEFNAVDHLPPGRGLHYLISHTVLDEWKFSCAGMSWQVDASKCRCISSQHGISSVMAKTHWRDSTKFLKSNDKTWARERAAARMQGKTLVQKCIASLTRRSIPDEISTRVVASHQDRPVTWLAGIHAHTQTFAPTWPLLKTFGQTAWGPRYGFDKCCCWQSVLKNGSPPLIKGDQLPCAGHVGEADTLPEYATSAPNACANVVQV